MGASVSLLNAAEIKAPQLISSCSSPKSDEQASCMGYIGGIIDGARTQEQFSGRAVFRHSLTGKTWCGSKDHNLINATNNVVEFFREDIISHSVSALMLVINALKTRQPCTN